MKKKILVILANGFEEIEAITAIDVLRRAGLDVTIAGLSGTSIKGARGASVKADTDLEDVDFVPDAVILPGGMPGAENLANSQAVKDIVKTANAKGKIVAAICASPAIVLSPLGVLDGKKATCYPGMEESFSPEIKFTESPVVQDGNIITSRGPATAIPFALKILESLSGKDTAEMVKNALLYNG